MANESIRVMCRKCNFMNGKNNIHCINCGKKLEDARIEDFSISTKKDRKGN